MSSVASAQRYSRNNRLNDWIRIFLGFKTLLLMTEQLRLRLILHRSWGESKSSQFEKKYIKMAIRAGFASAAAAVWVVILLHAGIEFSNAPTLILLCDVFRWGRSILQLPNSNQPDPHSRCILLICFSVPRQCVRCVFWYVPVHIAAHHQRTFVLANIHFSVVCNEKLLCLLISSSEKTYFSQCPGHAFPTFR